MQKESSRTRTSAHECNSSTHGLHVLVGLLPFTEFGSCSAAVCHPSFHLRPSCVSSSRPLCCLVFPVPSAFLLHSFFTLSLSEVVRTCVFVHCSHEPFCNQNYPPTATPETLKLKPPVVLRSNFQHPCLAARNQMMSFRHYCSPVPSRP